MSTTDKHIGADATTPAFEPEGDYPPAESTDLDDQGDEEFAPRLNAAMFAMAELPELLRRVLRALEPAAGFSTQLAQVSDATSAPVQLSPQHGAKRAVMLVNNAATGGPTVYLARDRRVLQSATSGGVPLAPGAGITLPTAAAVYGICDAGLTALVSVVTFFNEEV